MYYRVVSQCVRNLKTIENYLDKAEQLAAVRKFDVSVLLTGRLAPDMKNFIYQVQSACDYVKGAAGWLSGQKPPRHEDNEQTLAEVRERIRKTISFAESIAEEQYAGAGGQRITIGWAGGKIIDGQNYLTQITIPNVYFHITMAYAILRHNGVEIGKLDFLGDIDFVTE